jgi:hypothetical protein
MTAASQSKRAVADAKRDMALHALVAARRTGLASEQAAAMVACDAWLTAELAAGRVTA